MQGFQHQESVAYGLIILHSARKHGGHGWLLYDTALHQKIAAGSPLACTDLNASIMHQWSCRRLTRLEGFLPSLSGGKQAFS